MGAKQGMIGFISLVSINYLLMLTDLAAIEKYILNMRLKCSQNRCSFDINFLAGFKRRGRNCSCHSWSNYRSREGRSDKPTKSNVLSIGRS